MKRLKQITVLAALSLFWASTSANAELTATPAKAAVPACDVQCGKSAPELSFSAFLKAIADQEIASATIPTFGGRARGRTRDGSAYHVFLGGSLDESLARDLVASGAEVFFENLNPYSDENEISFIEGLIDWLPLIAFFVPLLAIWTILAFADRNQSRKATRRYHEQLEAHYARIEKTEAAFFERMEKLLSEIVRRG